MQTKIYLEEDDIRNAVITMLNHKGYAIVPDTLQFRYYNPNDPAKAQVTADCYVDLVPGLASAKPPDLPGPATEKVTQYRA